MFILPLPGMFFYLVSHGRVFGKRRQEINIKINQRFKTHIRTISDFTITSAVDKPHIKRHITYLRDTANSPAQINTETEYYKIGEEFLNPLLEELKKAEKFIFLEYFIIKEGEVWDEIEKILIDKVSQGIEVRVMYDEVGSMFTVNKKFSKRLIANGIECKVFNPYKNIITIGYNNRDHRKICIIDGMMKIMKNIYQQKPVIMMG